MASLIAFVLTPVGRLVAIGLAVAALSGVCWFIYSHIEQGGYDRAVREIAADNQEAITRVRLAKNKLNACIDRGKSWDQSSGLCIE